MHGLEPFKYLEANNLPEALHLLSRYLSKAKILAGGVDLIPRMRLHKISPEYVIGINRIVGLDSIRDDSAEFLRIGALTTLRSIERSETVKSHFEVLHRAVQSIASVQVKTMGTAVGNLCVATPASDIAPALFVLDAGLRIVGPGNGQIVPIEGFFKGVNHTILREGQIVTEIVLPYPKFKTETAFFKVARTSTDVSKVNGALAVCVEKGVCEHVRIALGSVAPTVIMARKAERILEGQVMDRRRIESVAMAASEESVPITDIRSTAAYRRELVKVLVRRALISIIETS